MHFCVWCDRSGGLCPSHFEESLKRDEEIRKANLYAIGMTLTIVLLAVATVVFR